MGQVLHRSGAADSRNVAHQFRHQNGLGGEKRRALVPVHGIPCEASLGVPRILYASAK